jgi:hypothetical protein
LEASRWRRTKAGKDDNEARRDRASLTSAKRLTKASLADSQRVSEAAASQEAGEGEGETREVGDGCGGARKE